MYNGQLEMSFEHARTSRPGTRRQRRLARARWWFRCMRQAVSSATEWQPAPPPRPQQTWLAGTHREIELPPVLPLQPPSLEEQVCE